MGVRGELNILLSGILLTRLLGFYLSTVTTFSIIEDVCEIEHFLPVGFRVSCIQYIMVLHRHTHPLSRLL